MFARLQISVFAAVILSVSAAPTPYTNYGGLGGILNGAGDQAHIGDNVSNSFQDIDEINGGFAQGSGNFSIGNNGALGGNNFTSIAKRDTNYGGEGGSFNGAGLQAHIGDNISNSFEDVGEGDGGFAQGSGNFNIGNNGAYGGNTFANDKRDTSYGGVNGTFNGAGDQAHIGDNIANTFDDVDEVNSGFSQGSGTYDIQNNGAHGGNTLPANDKRDNTYGGVNGTFNGAADEVHFGDNISNSFDDVDEVNSGFAQGNGDFDIVNNGAYGGNTFTSNDKRDTNDGGVDGEFTGAGDEVHQGDDISNSFSDVGEVNGGFAQGSGEFTIGNNGAFSGNQEESE